MVGPQFLLISMGDPITPQKTNMTMENPPFEDVFPSKNGDFSMSC